MRLQRFYILFDISASIPFPLLEIRIMIVLAFSHALSALGISRG